MQLDPPLAQTEVLTRVDSERELFRSAWQRLTLLVSANHFLGLADQAIVSATSFAALVMLGRWTEPEQLGTYAVGFSVLSLLLATQDSLITRPYSIRLESTVGRQTERAFGWLALSLTLSFAVTVVLAAATLIFFALDLQRPVIEILCALTSAAPFVLLREFARRFAFAHWKIINALTVDLLTSVLTVVFLSGLALAGKLSAATAILAIGASSAIVSALWLYSTRRQFTFRTRYIRVAGRKSWAIGKWFLSGQLALQAQGYVTPWLAMLIAGAAVTGVYAACASIVAFANPFLYGYFNLLTPKSVRVLKRKGVAGLRRQAIRDSLLLGIVMGAFSVALFVAGRDLIHFIYPGAGYSQQTHVLAVLAVAAMAAAIGAPASIALAAAERARATANVTIIMAVVNVTLIGVLLSQWGLLGAAYGILAAELIGAAARWTAFLALVRDPDGEKSASVNSSRCGGHFGDDLQAAVNLKAPGWSTMRETGIGTISGSGRMLLRVLRTLDRAGVRYSLLHGYDEYPRRIASDVDILIDQAVAPARLLRILHQAREWIGGEVVRWRGYYFVLAGKNGDGSVCFLELDFSTDCVVFGIPMYTGSDALTSRRRYGQFWILEPKIEFAWYLARTILKDALQGSRTRILTRLYNEDAVGCSGEIGRIWSAYHTNIIRDAAQSGEWQSVRKHLDALSAELRARRRISQVIGSKLTHWIRRLGGVARRESISVVLLGPDGAGKSSVIEAVAKIVRPAFARWVCWGFAPSVRNLLGYRSGSTDQPHALPARPWLVSLLRAGYWLVYYTLAHLRLKFTLRQTLVLYDRHFVDILVDAKRYRYGGPSRLLKLIWQVIPKPDLIVLLNAPPEVLQRRKQEVPFEETVRQHGAYLSLVQGLENSLVIDGARPLDQVAADVSGIILSRVAGRIAGDHHWKEAPQDVSASGRAPQGRIAEPRAPGSENEQEGPAPAKNLECHSIPTGVV